jgi:hypothetical protein
MTRFKVVLFTALTLLGLLGAPIKQATADHILAVQINCKMHLKAPVGMKVIGPNKGMLIPATIACGKNHFGGPPGNADLNYCGADIVPITPNSKAQQKAPKSKATKALTKPPGANPSNCDLVAPKSIVVGPGALGGPWNCNWAGGGTATLIVNKTKAYNLAFIFTAQGGTMTVTGTITKKGSGQSGPFEALLSCNVDRLKGDSKIGPPWADDFTIAGNFAAVLRGPKP